MLGFTGFEILYFCCLALFIAVLGVMSIYPFMKAFQQSGYNAVSYKNWMKKDSNKLVQRLRFVSIFSGFTYVLFVILFGVFNFKMACALGLIFPMIFFSMFLNHATKNERQQLVNTDRVMRLKIAILAIIFIVTLGFAIVMDALLKDENAFQYFRFIGFLPCLITLPLLAKLVYKVNYLMLPIEKKINSKYIAKAKQKISENSQTKYIGITGSYGKTSQKNILASILSEKFSVAKTPASFNTPMGVVKSVMENFNGEEIFIVEMGARNVGDIKELCDIVPCEVGLITSVGNQHLETFGSMENISKTKYELAENITANGKMFFNADSDGATALYEKYDGNKMATSLAYDGKGISILNIVSDKDGSTFTLNIDSESVTVTTKLLGNHNVSNILQAVAVANYYGMSIEQIKEGIEKAEVTPHRLQIVENSNGITVIDDSYNANPKGVSYALDVLKCFDENRIVITSGLVELGDDEQKENQLLGEKLVSSCNYAVLVGSERGNIIADAMKEQGYNEENIIIADSLDEAMMEYQKVVKPGDTVLFLNDLPDYYLK